MRKLLFICLLGATPCLAADFVVNSLATTADASDDGLCDTANDPERDIPPSGICTLSAALTEGRLQGGSHTITFGVQGEIPQQIIARTAAFTITGPITITGAATFEAGVTLNDVTLNGRLIIRERATLRGVTLGEQASITADGVILDDVAAPGAQINGDDAAVTNSRVGFVQINGARARITDGGGGPNVLGDVVVRGEGATITNAIITDQLEVDGAGARIADTAIGYDADGAVTGGQVDLANAVDCVVQDNQMADALNLTGQDCVISGNRIGLTADGLNATQVAPDCDIEGPGNVVEDNIAVCDLQVIGGARLVDNLVGYNINGVVLQPAQAGLTQSDGGLIAGNFITETLGARGDDLVVRDNQIGLNFAGDEAALQGGSNALIAGGNRVVVLDNIIAGRISLDGNATVFQGNRVGTDAAGSVALGDEVRMSVGGDAILLGGVDPEDRNVIVADEVRVRGDGVIIQGNHIGVDLAGNTRLFRGRFGIILEGDNALIGEDGDLLSAPGAVCDGGCNVIAGHTESGISGGGPGHIITRNHIGVGRDGVTAIGGRGIDISSVGVRVSNNRMLRLGGTAIIVDDLDDAANEAAFLIEDNLIGLAQDGTAVEGGGAILVRGDNRDMAAGGRIVGNTIVNSFSGIVVRRSGAVEHPILIQRNRVGLLPDGTLSGCGTEGISVSGGLIEVGGAVEDGNVSADNGRRGVHVVQGVGHRVQGNRIFGNTLLGLSLGNGNVPLPNDPGDADVGPNNNQNAPVLGGVQIEDGQARITGALDSAADTAFDIEIFASEACDPSGAGEGQVPLGRGQVRTDAQNAGLIDISVEVPPGAGAFFTATATDPDGNTSEFSNCAVLERLVVNRADDLPDLDPNDRFCDVDAAVEGEQCTLRAAIQEAEARPAGDRIEFEVPGGVIDVGAPLPVITAAVDMDGSGQAGGRPVIDGAGLLFDTADPISIRGLEISRSEADGLRQEGRGALTIEGVFIDAACRWGVQAAGDVIARDSDIADSGQGIECEGGGVLVLGDLDARATTTNGNDGPGIAVLGDAFLADVRSDANTGHGVYVQDGALDVRPADGRTLRVTDNGGAGVALTAPCDDIDCVEHIIQGGLTAEDNTGWGVVADGPIVIAVRAGAAVPTAVAPSSVARNGEGPVCAGIGALVLDPSQPAEPCLGGGILSASRGVLTADVRATSNFGPGVMALRDIQLARTQLIDNGGDGAHSANGHIDVVGTPDAAEAEVVVRGNRGFGLFAAGVGDDDAEVFGLTAFTRLEISENGRWGAFAQAGISVGQIGLVGIGLNARTIVERNGVGADCVRHILDPGTFLPIVDDVNCEGGGLGSSDGSVIFQADVRENVGPGIAARASLTLLDVQVRDNGGDGVFSEFGDIAFIESVTGSVSRDNAGFGVRALSNDVEVRANLSVTGNGSAGMTGEDLRLGFLGDLPLDGVEVQIVGNGAGLFCFDVELLADDVLAREEIDCVPDGLLADTVMMRGGAVNAQAGDGIRADAVRVIDVDVLDNQGVGVVAESLEASAGQICRNVRTNLRVTGAVTLQDTVLCDDFDFDGIIDDVEQLIGDGNRDEQPDFEQAQVAAIEVIDAAGQPAEVVFELLDAGVLRQVIVEPLAELGVVPPEGVQLPVGLFSFRVEGIEVGGTVRVQVRFPAELGINSFFKLSAGELFEFIDDGATGAAIAEGSAILTLVDGGRGDADGEANGRISDPGGPAIIDRGVADLAIALNADPDAQPVGGTAVLSGDVTNHGDGDSEPSLLVLQTSLGTLANLQLGGADCVPVDARIECPVAALVPGESVDLIGELTSAEAGEATVAAVLDAVMASTVVRFEDLPPPPDAGVEPDVDLGVDAFVEDAFVEDAFVEDAFVEDAAVEPDATPPEPDAAVDDAFVEDAAPDPDAAIEDAYIALDAAPEPDAAIEDAFVYQDAAPEPDATVIADAQVYPDADPMPEPMPVPMPEPDATVYDDAEVADADIDAADADRPDLSPTPGGGGDSGCTSTPGGPAPLWMLAPLLIALGGRRRWR